MNLPVPDSVLAFSFKFIVFLLSLLSLLQFEDQKGADCISNGGGGAHMTPSSFLYYASVEKWPPPFPTASVDYMTSFVYLRILVMV